MKECLGISIDDNFIRYAKVQMDEKNNFKVSSYGISPYNNIELSNKINQIIEETNSSKSPISIDIQNEKYYFFNFFRVQNKKYIKEAIETEFSSFCIDNHLNKNALEYRSIFTKSLESSDKNKAICVYANKGDIEERLNLFKDVRVSTVTTDPVAVTTIANIEPNRNIMFVDIGDITKVTTVVDREIYSIDILSSGLKEAFYKIEAKENSAVKAYEVLKNTTIYTMDMETSSNAANDEYLQYIVPNLYKIAQEVQNIAKNYNTIDQIYLTGYGTVINNIELYFQEFFKNSRVEILKPFFLNRLGNADIKGYIEVNQATALALQGLGFGYNRFINFSNTPILDFRSLMNMDVKDFAQMRKGASGGNTSGKNGKGSFFSKLDLSSGGAYESSITNALIVVLIVTIIYCVGSGVVTKQIRAKVDEVKDVKLYTELQIAKATTDDSKINTKTNDYKKYKKNLEDTSNVIEVKRSRKNQIVTLMYKISSTIPRGVTISEIKNTEVQGNDGSTVEHIIIRASSNQYEQLAYFKAKLKNANILENVVSTQGDKSGDTVTTTIEGDLKSY